MGGKETRTCYECGRVGHLSRDCYKKRQKEQAEQPKLATAREQAIWYSDDTPKDMARTKETAMIVALLDSGATKHITGDRTILKNMKTLKEGEQLTFKTAGEPVIATERGDLIGRLENGNEVAIRDVYYVPGTTATLISEGMLMDRNEGSSIMKTGNKFEIRGAGGTTMLKGTRQGALYPIKI